MQTRREFLAAGAALTVPTVAPAGSRPPSAKAKACIFINLVGGPSHLDTFDPKPDARSDVRGPFRPIRTAVPGTHLSELFPRLAAMADRFSLIRSMHHPLAPVHEVGLQLNNTGHYCGDGTPWPTVGAVLAHRAGQELGDLPLWAVVPGPRVTTGRAAETRLSAGWLAEPDCGPLFARMLPPNWTFALSCSMAVGLIRHQRFVTLNMYPTVFDAPSWDCHADGGSLNTTLDDYRTAVAPAFDTAFPKLLTDLDDRGLLDSTLVVATGEFGRTPLLNANGGRDHWAGAWTALVAGGGVQGGRVIGRTDRHGTEPTDRPVTPQDLVSTIYHALGVPADATISGPTGTSVAVYPGSPVVELF